LAGDRFRLRNGTGRRAIWPCLGLMTAIPINRRGVWRAAYLLLSANNLLYIKRRKITIYPE